MGDIWERKMKTYFRRFDFDKDGVIKQRDFEAMAESFCDAHKVDPALKETIKQCLRDIFSQLTKSSGSTDDVLLTEDLMLESMQLLRDEPSFKDFISDTLHTVLTAMDGNLDGYLDCVRYRRFFESLGIIESDFTKEGFNAIDGDQDGKLSFEEFINATKDYMCSDNEGTTALLGLLI